MITRSHTKRDTEKEQDDEHTNNTLFDSTYRRLIDRIGRRARYSVYQYLSAIKGLDASHHRRRTRCSRWLEVLHTTEHPGPSIHQLISSIHLNNDARASDPTNAEFHSPEDINDDGMLNFFDVSSFLSLLSAGRP